jgi:protein kinase-like protein
MSDVGNKFPDFSAHLRGQVPLGARIQQSDIKQKKRKYEEIVHKTVSHGQEEPSIHKKKKYTSEKEMETKIAKLENTIFKKEYSTIEEKHQARAEFYQCRADLENIYLDSIRGTKKEYAKKLEKIEEIEGMLGEKEEESIESTSVQKPEETAKLATFRSRIREIARVMDNIVKEQKHLWKADEVLFKLITSMKQLHEKIESHYKNMEGAQLEQSISHDLILFEKMYRKIQQRIQVVENGFSSITSLQEKFSVYKTQFGEIRTSHLATHPMVEECYQLFRELETILKSNKYHDIQSTINELESRLERVELYLLRFQVLNSFVQLPAHIQTKRQEQLLACTTKEDVHIFSIIIMLEKTFAEECKNILQFAEKIPDEAIRQHSKHEIQKLSLPQHIPFENGKVSTAFMDAGQQVLKKWAHDIKKDIFAPLLERLPSEVREERRKTLEDVRTTEEIDRFAVLLQLEEDLWQIKQKMLAEIEVLPTFAERKESLKLEVGALCLPQEINLKIDFSFKEDVQNKIDFIIKQIQQITIDEYKKIFNKEIKALPEQLQQRHIESHQAATSVEEFRNVNIILRTDGRLYKERERLKGLLQGISEEKSQVIRKSIEQLVLPQSFLANNADTFKKKALEKIQRIEKKISELKELFPSPVLTPGPDISPVPSPTPIDILIRDESNPVKKELLIFLKDPSQMPKTEMQKFFALLLSGKDKEAELVIINEKIHIQDLKEAFLLAKKALPIENRIIRKSEEIIKLFDSLKAEFTGKEYYRDPELLKLSAFAQLYLRKIGKQAQAQKEMLYIQKKQFPHLVRSVAFDPISGDLFILHKSKKRTAGGDVKVKVPSGGFKIVKPATEVSLRTFKTIAYVELGIKKLPPEKMQTTQQIQHEMQKRIKVHLEDANFLKAHGLDKEPYFIPPEHIVRHTKTFKDVYGNSVQVSTCSLLAKRFTYSISELEKNNIPVTLEEYLLIAESLCKGVECMHNRDVVHYDLKGGNAMVHKSPVDNKIDRCCLIDFGLAFNANDIAIGMNRPCYGTPVFGPPESIQGIKPVAGEQKTFYKQADMYAVGTILYELLYKRRDFHHTPLNATCMVHLATIRERIAIDIQTAGPTQDAKLRQVKELIWKLLDPNRNNRPTAAQATQIITSIRNAI